ncbi:hypothetical protein BVIR_794 [Blastochloris viridis]|uniref:DUF2865 domain-containing protein n=2 Tax=Blastochloris viridis TaxID=1079 RepID=A0A0H5B7H6_BLAVI|nr:hypothetical protein BVIR_794 [Blastochloris viridis]BAR98125.1 hypothetical protein BV133_532 [Blastochloris viridis]CUU41250.1 hypothetical protein BVIRIDIS_02390 [Blastochloris viridis]
MLAIAVPIAAVLAPVLASVLALFAGPAAAQAPGMPQAQMQMCIRLEAELARIDRPSGDAYERRRYEEAIARQQAELDRTIAQAQRLGCTRPTDFFLFGAPERPRQCDQLDRQIDRIRQNLDRMMSELGRFRGAQGADRDFQRRQLLVALAQNNCGPQYRAALPQQPPQQRARPRSGNFFEQLFGQPGEFYDDEPTTEPPADLAAPTTVGTYRTVCVRTCDGFYFPISFSATPVKFGEDEHICKAQCPAAEVMLFAHRNPGEDVANAMSIDGQQRYSKLPNAFRYRQTYDPSCACKPAGQSWAEAIGQLDNTVQRGDIVVTEERSKALQLKALEEAKEAAKPQPKPSRDKKTGRKTDPAAALPPPPEPAPAAPELQQPSTAAAPDGRGVRVVGPTFLPGR